MHSVILSSQVIIYLNANAVCVGYSKNSYTNFVIIIIFVIASALHRGVKNTV